MLFTMMIIQSKTKRIRQCLKWQIYKITSNKNCIVPDKAYQKAKRNSSPNKLNKSYSS